LRVWGDLDEVMDGVFHRALDRVGSRYSLSNYFWMEGCFGRKEENRWR